MEPSVSSKSIFRKEVIPFALIIVLLFVNAIFIDYQLHWKNLSGIGRYIGIIGTLLILTSFVYSLRKQKRITFGSPSTFLAVHEWMAWVGALLILIHSGIHFNSLLPWLATWAMMVVVLSGFVGRSVLKRSLRTMRSRKEALINEGKTPDEAEQILYWDSVMVKAMKKWRSFHMPITSIFGLLAGIHIFTILFYWSWR